MAREAVSRLAGERIDNPAEIADGVGEMVNMIAGNAKAALQQFEISLSFPHTVRGKGHEMAFHRHFEMEKLYFASEIGKAAVIVAYSLPAVK